MTAAGRQRSSRLLRAGSALLAGILAGGPADAQQTAVSGPDVQVSVGSDLVHVEPVIAADPADPDRLVVASIALRRPHAPDWQDHQTVRIYSSDDGGRSWTQRPVATLPDGWTAGDPWLAWTPAGLVLAAIAGEAITFLGDPPARARVFFSNDGGSSWPRGGATPFAAGAAEDHPVLAWAPAHAADGAAALYAVASHAAAGADGIDAARVEWPAAKAEPRNAPIESLRPALDGVLNLGGAVVRLGGELVVTFFSSVPPRRLWSARRDPATRAWTTARIRDAILPVGFPSLTWDPGSDGSSPFAGQVYAAWAEEWDGGGLRVLVAASDDGLTWTEPVSVHTDTSRASRTLPTLAVAPDGAVGVLWQDARHADGRTCYDVYGAISVDGGASFLPEVRVSDETACAGGYEENGAAASRFRLGGGDYQGLAATGPGAFRAVWADARTGRYQLWSAPLRVHRVESAGAEPGAATEQGPRDGLSPPSSSGTPWSSPIQRRTGGCVSSAATSPTSTSTTTTARTISTGRWGTAQRTGPPSSRPSAPTPRTPSWSWSATTWNRTGRAWPRCAGTSPGSGRPEVLSRNG